jgi:hypothetical protein
MMFVMDNNRITDGLAHDTDTTYGKTSQIDNTRIISTDLFSQFSNFSLRRRLKRCPRLESTSGRHVESHSAYWMQIQLVAVEARHFSVHQPPTEQTNVSPHSARSQYIS